MQMLENFNYEKQTNNYGIQTKNKTKHQKQNKSNTRETFSAKIRLKYIIKEKRK